MCGIRLAVIGVLAFGGTWAEGRKISFAPAQNFSSAVVSPACAATGDFNGDGKADLVVTNHTGSVAVFLGVGDGTFMPPTIYTTDFYYIGCVVVGDFNGDGKLDAVMNGGDSSMNALALLTGNGDGTFNLSYSMAAQPGDGVSMAVGDLNNDHNLDIFIGGNSGSEVVLGDGKGGFQPGFVAFGVSGFGVVLGDFNGDGNLDVAGTSLVRPHQVSVLFGNGDGTFQAPQDYHTEFGATGVVAGDFNGDQKLDLAVAAGYVFIFLGNGDGTFTSAGEWGYSYPTGSIVAADFNKDGKLDLAVSSYNRPRVEALTGQGRRNFPVFHFLANRHESYLRGGSRFQ